MPETSTYWFHRRVLSVGLLFLLHVSGSSLFQEAVYGKFIKPYPSDAACIPVQFAQCFVIQVRIVKPGQCFMSYPLPRYVQGYFFLGQLPMLGECNWVCMSFPWLPSVRQMLEKEGCSGTKHGGARVGTNQRHLKIIGHQKHRWMS